MKCVGWIVLSVVVAAGRVWAQDQPPVDAPAADVPVPVAPEPAAPVTGDVIVSPHPAKPWVDRAMAEASRIESRSDQAEAYGTLAGAAAEAGDRESYQKAITLAMAAAKETDELTMGATMWSIAESQARAGDVDAALATASHAGDQAYIALAYAAAARALGERGRIDDARRALAAASEHMGKLTDELDLGWALYYVAEAQLATHDIDAAVRTIEPCKDQVSRAETLAAIAAQQGKLGQIEAGLQRIEQCRAVMEQAKATIPAQELYLDFGMAKLAEAQAHCGQLDAAAQTLQLVTDPSPRSWAMVELARVHFTAGRVNDARKLVNEAIEATSVVEEPYERASNWSEIGAAMVELDMAAGLTAWVEGLNTPMERAFASIGVANGLIRKHSKS